MKKIKIQILLMIVLLCQGLPVIGMIPQATSRMAQRARRSQFVSVGVPSGTSINPLIEKPTVVGVPAKSQTGWQRFLSWVSGSPKRAVPKQEAPRYQAKPSPFTSGTQRRTFSETRPQQASPQDSTFTETRAQQASPQDSWFNKITSFFGPRTELTLEEIDDLLWGHRVEVSPGFRSYPVFGDEDLKIAMEKIGLMIESNPKYKHAIIQKWTQTLPFTGPSYGEPEFTILDKVIVFLFAVDRDTAQVINRIKLAKYLIDKGAQINPNNHDMYKKAYFSWLMSSHKKLYDEGAEYRIAFLEDQRQKFKELFKELDPILEKLLPGFKDELEAAQRERRKIELNLLITDNPAAVIRNLLPGLTETSSKEEIAKAFRAFQLKNHPDKLPKDISDKDREEIDKKVKEVNVAWDAYNEQLKRQQQRTTE